MNAGIIDMSDGTGLPSQKELEREISQYLAKKYGEQVKIVSANVFAQPENVEKDGREKVVSKPENIDFSLTPEELVDFLDDYVVQQEEAKAVLATKICTHFNRIRYAQENAYQKNRNIGQIKSNVLLIGPTGVGKTFLIKLIAQRIGVPFVKGDATKFSETGYVGGDVEDLVRDLLRQADGDIDKAQYGIIYVDEIDKIAASQGGRWGADVSRTGVQRAFLKPMEETEVDLKVPHDPISQLEAIEQYRATGKRGKRVINTRNILFIMSGAFGGLEEIIKKRVQQQGMGFEGSISSKKVSGQFTKQVKAEDLIEYGFESEFVGRLPIIGILDELTEKDLYEILLNPNSSVVVGKKQDFRAYGIHILFENDALKAIARKAAGEQTGARGLLSVMEKALLPFEKKLPSTDIKHLVVTTAMVSNPRRELENLLNQPENRELYRARYDSLKDEERLRLEEFILRTRGGYLETNKVLPTPQRLAMMARQCIEENMDSRDVCDEFIRFVRQIEICAKSISEKSGIGVAFNEDAIDSILMHQPRSIESIKFLCEKMTKAFEYGLQLLSHKKHMEKVIITAQGIETPEKFINELVGESFKI
ncbi:MAG: AAA family ATPase [Proteobacteria bacterium]|nr:AAA family ATPase [Pseudomonadota bacterium]